MSATSSSIRRRFSFTISANSESFAHCVISASSAASSTIDVDSVRRLWNCSQSRSRRKASSFSIRALLSMGTSGDEPVVVVPAQALCVRAIPAVLGQACQLLAMQAIVGLAVEILVPDPATDADAVVGLDGDQAGVRSEEHTSELQSLMRISYAVFCLK